MARRQNIPRPRERTWDEVSDLGKIYVSSEVILYSIEDIVNMTRWSYTTVCSSFVKVLIMQEKSPYRMMANSSYRA